MAPTFEEIRAVPKVLLHDHLDGGLRASTVVDLAREIGYDRLPSQDVGEVEAWLRRGANRGHLKHYLEAFQHTVGVMQTREALIRVAAECAEDLAADGVVYAEVRFAPELHVAGGLTLEQVVSAVLEGFRRGSAGRGITVYALLTAMRTAARSLEIAELAVRHRDEGVVGFDIAGAEAGIPPTRHLDAFQYVARENFHITIHAGEGFGLPSIWEALQWCGAERLGHGVRIVDDIRVSPDGTAALGRLASYVRDRRIPLEMCPTSNVQTGAAPSIEEHPIGLLRQLSFRVTVNTDNRLMSGVTLSSEFAGLAEAFGYGWSDVEWLTINAMKSAFAPFDERLRIINTVIKPGFATARAASNAWRGPPGGRDGRASDGRERRPGEAGSGPGGGRDRPLAVARPGCGRGPPRTPRCARCCTGCPAWTRWARERAAALATRSIKKDAKLWALDAAIRMIDLTTLEGADTPGKVRGLCAKAPPARPRRPGRAARRRRLRLPRPGRGGPRALAGSDVAVASVATAFPSGRASLAVKLADVRAAVAAGADEVDMVIDRGAFLSGRYGQVCEEIRAVREVSGPAHLKVILETGELATLDNVARASWLAMLAGADFIKTSTGKVSARRDAAGRAGDAGRRARLCRGDWPPGRRQGGRRDPHRQGRHPLPGAGAGDRRAGVAQPGTVPHRRIQPAQRPAHAAPQAAHRRLRRPRLFS